jgi:hypothetical protein
MLGFRNIGNSNKLLPILPKQLTNVLKALAISNKTGELLRLKSVLLTKVTSKFGQAILNLRRQLSIVLLWARLTQEHFWAIKKVPIWIKPRPP